MSNLISSELLKLRSTRTFVSLTGAAIAIVLVITVLGSTLDKPSNLEGNLVDNLGVTALAQIFALVVGILAVSTEFRHGTITPSLLAVPSRTRLVVAKLIANGLAGLLLGVAAVGIALLAGLLIFSLRGIDTGASGGDLAGVAAGSIAACGLFAALGVGVGAVLRNQAGAIVAALVWLFVIENLVGAIPGLDEFPKYSIGGLSSGLAQADNGSDVLAPVPAGLLLALWALAFAVAGIALLQRRDVSA